jgi:hypothetical protein
MAQHETAYISEIQTDEEVFAGKLETCNEQDEVMMQVWDQKADLKN